MRYLWICAALLATASHLSWIAKNSVLFLRVHLGPGWKTEVRMDGLLVGFRY